MSVAIPSTPDEFPVSEGGSQFEPHENRNSRKFWIGAAGAAALTAALTVGSVLNRSSETDHEPAAVVGIRPPAESLSPAPDTSLQSHLSLEARRNTSSAMVAEVPAAPTVTAPAEQPVDTVVIEPVAPVPAAELAAPQEAEPVPPAAPVTAAPAVPPAAVRPAPRPRPVATTVAPAPTPATVVETAADPINERPRTVNDLPEEEKVYAPEVAPGAIDPGTGLPSAELVMKDDPPREAGAIDIDNDGNPLAANLND